MRLQRLVGTKKLRRRAIRSAVIQDDHMLKAVDEPEEDGFNRGIVNAVICWS